MDEGSSRRRYGPFPHRPGSNTSGRRVSEINLRTGRRASEINLRPGRRMSGPSIYSTRRTSEPNVRSDYRTSDNDYDRVVLEADLERLELEIEQELDQDGNDQDELEREPVELQVAEFHPYPLRLVGSNTIDSPVRATRYHYAVDMPYGTSMRTESRSPSPEPDTDPLDARRRRLTRQLHDLTHRVHTHSRLLTHISDRMVEAMSDLYCTLPAHDDRYTTPHELTREVRETTYRLSGMAQRLDHTVSNVSLPTADNPGYRRPWEDEGRVRIWELPPREQTSRRLAMWVREMSPHRSRDESGHEFVIERDADGSWTNRVALDSPVSFESPALSSPIIRFRPRSRSPSTLSERSDLEYLGSESSALDDPYPKTVRYTANDGSGTSSCAICMEEFAQGELIDELPCSALHVFHGECIATWARQNRNCPNCRIPFRLPR